MLRKKSTLSYPGDGMNQSRLNVNKKTTPKFPFLIFKKDQRVFHLLGWNREYEKDWLNPYLSEDNVLH
jgi:hypothetical protein